LKADGYLLRNFNEKSIKLQFSREDSIGLIDPVLFRSSAKRLFSFGPKE